MQLPIERYLAMIKRELATSLMPKEEDDNAHRIATYTLRVLNQMLTRLDALPALQVKALADLGALLNELCAELRGIDGAMVLCGDLTRHIHNKPDFAQLEPVLQRAARVLIEHPSDARKKLLQRITSILLELEEAFDAAARAGEQLPASNDNAEIPPLDAAQRQALQAYLRKQFDEPAVELGRIKSIAGGGSKITLIIKLLHAKQLPDTIVLRGDQKGGVVESTVIDEYQLLSIVYAAGLPVPRPFVAESDASITGAPFILVGYLEGVNNGDQISIYAPSRDFGLDLARAIGKLHAIPPERFGDKIPGAKLSTREFVKHEMAVFERIWRSSEQPSVASELGYAWLKEHMDFVEGPRALNHRDLACHNMLAKDGRLTAILDWETTVITNPAHDLAYLYPLIIQMMPWEEFLAEYEQAGGKRPSARELDFFRMWTQLWRVAYMFVARSFFHAGIADSTVLAYGTQHLWQRSNYELHKIVKELYERY